MRRRARQRLIGATVLVLLAIIGFPMLFDTQPRPVAVNASIEIPDREKVAALTVAPGAVVGRPTPATPPGHPARTEEAGLADGEEIVSDSSSAARPTVAPVVPEPVRPAEVAKPEVKPEPKPKEEPKPVAKPEPKPAAVAKPEPKPKEEKPKEPAKPKRDNDADRIRALMENRSTTSAAPAAPAASKPPAAAARYVVQVGAFAEADKASEVRAKLQMAGVAAYTQSVKTAAGTRIRVRVGPFNSKDDADRAAAKIKAQGLPAALVPM